MSESSASESLKTRMIVCRCGFVLAAWSYPRPVSPESNLDKLFENLAAHRSRLRGHGLRYLEY